MKKKILIISGILVLCLGLFACGDSQSAEGSAAEGNATTGSAAEGSASDISSAELSKKITVSGAIDKKDLLVVTAKNGNTATIDLMLEAEFYDGEGNIVGSADEEFYGVGANGEVAVEFYDTPEKFDTYKVFADAEATTCNSYYDKVELKHNDSGDQIAVQLKNTSEEDIPSLWVYVVFYKEDKVVGAEEGFESDVKAGRSANFNISYPYSKSYDEVSFDKYKVFINSAMSW